MPLNLEERMAFTPSELGRIFHNMPVDLEERLMFTPRELGRMLPFHRGSWLRWLRAGRVPGAVKVGGRWLVPAKVAEQLMAGVTPLHRRPNLPKAAAGGER